MVAVWVITVDPLETDNVMRKAGMMRMSAYSGSALRRTCERCGIALRQGRSGTRCGPCSCHPDIAEQLREAGFFTWEAVQRALAAYDFGYLFRAVRRTAGLTQVELGQVLGIEQDRISRFERGERQLRDIETIARIAMRLGIPPALLGFDPTAVTDSAPAAGDALAVRQGGTPVAIPDSSSTPAMVAQPQLPHKIVALISSYPDNAQVLVPRAVRALETTRRTAVSELAALEDIDTVVEHYKQTFRNTSPAELYNEVLGVRVHVGTLLDTTPTGNNHPDLVVAAGWLSNLLALVTHDLRDRAASLVWCADAERCSREAHYPELAGWAALTRVRMAFYDGQAREAVTHAQRGQQLAPLGTVAHAELVAQEMRAWALIGNSGKVSSTRWHAEKAIAKLSPDTPTRGAFSISLADDPPYTATSLLLLGRYKEAEKATRRVISAFYCSETGEGRREHPSGFARTYLILALALAGLGKLDEAYSAGSVALEAPRLVWPVVMLAGKLDRTLVRDFPDTTEACAYHERYVAIMRQNSSLAGQLTLFGASSS